jgi:hypothetical protein
MPNTLIEQAELNKLMRWLRDIEEIVKAIKKDPEDPDIIVEQCRCILKTVEKLRSFLVIIRD